MLPIFIGWTRSFWLGIFPALLITLDVAVQLAAVVFADPELVPPVAWLVGWMLGLDPIEVQGWMLRMSPLFALLIAQQRAGYSHPSGRILPLWGPLWRRQSVFTARGIAPASQIPPKN